MRKGVPHTPLTDFADGLVFNGQEFFLKSLNAGSAPTTEQFLIHEQPIEEDVGVS